MPYKCPIKQKESQHKSYLKNKLKVNADSKAWKKANPEIIKAGFRKYYEKNKPMLREKRNKWGRENRDRINERKAFRRAMQAQRTPKWLTKEDIKTIRRIFQMAKHISDSTGVSHHVDHIIPLQGLLVSGLHVPTNLQILRADENIRKSNKFIPGELAQN